MSTKDDELLRDLGYEQKMHREWSIVQNFGISFTIISVITGITTLFSYGLNTGGPAVMSLGWIVVCFFTSFVALGMAQITSAIPTAGGPYYWAAALAPPKHSAFVSWVTGYFNFLGQVAVTTGISFGCAGLITTLYTVSHPDAVITPAKNLGVYAAIMASHIILNCIGGKVLIWLNNFSILLHSFGVASVAIAILAKAPKLQSAKFVFTTFNDNTNWSVRASKPYVAVIGLLISQYTITGFDASAHLAEETRNAARSSPIGVLMSVAISAVFGWFLMLSYLFAIQDLASVIDNPYGQPVLQIMIDSCGTKGGQALMSIVILCVWHCGLFSLTSNSRMAYAFARDKGIPSFFDHVSPRTGVPVRTIALMATLAFLLAVPSLGSSVAFAAATSIATSGLYISYAIPILVGLIYEKDFKKGPFNLGIMSRPVAFIAVAWVAFITIVFCLPSVTPVDSQTLNYTPVAIGIVLLWVFGSWFLFARKYFVGPINQVEKDLAHIPEAGGNADILEDAKKNAY